MTTPFQHEQLGPLAPSLATVLADLAASEAVARLWDRDHTLWSEDPTELADRMGWLEVSTDTRAAGDRLDALAAGLVADGVRHVVVMGMGGSSLFPEVLARTFEPGPDAPAIVVLDSTDPAAVAHVAARCPAADSVFIAASKSGGTVETRSHLEFFWDRIGDGSRFVAITDPGSELEAIARERGFREVFLNRADIGGRYSALSFFGMVPAAAAGLDWRGLLDAADGIAASLRDPDPAANPGLRLGALLAAGVRDGRDKATLVLDPRIASFGLWLEQLIAESTGKAGTGVVPVADEPLGAATAYGNDRVFVAVGEVEHPIGLEVLADEGSPVARLALGDLAGLGAQVLLWEVATALCGAALGINPFDQPNVAEAKAATNEVLASGPPDLDPGSLDDVLAAVVPGDYLAIQAYVDPFGADVDALAELRAALRDHLVVATTLGLGPRFLHSTGQLHKGGPPTGVFVQIVGDDAVDAPVPGASFTFSTLKHAQADGDLVTLRAHGLRAVRTTAADLAAYLAAH